MAGGGDQEQRSGAQRAAGGTAQPWAEAGGHRKNRVEHVTIHLIYLSGLHVYNHLICTTDYRRVCFPGKHQQ